MAADCYTIANETWSCGTPSPSDNLTVTHAVTIASSLTTTGNITITNGGKLVITGNLISSNCKIIIENGVLQVDGNVEIGNQCEVTVNGSFNIQSSLYIRSGSTYLLKGSNSINGNTTLYPGSNVIMKRDSDFLVTGNFTNNGSATEVDGVLTINQGFNNNNLIAGIGEISFTSCSGTGAINDITSDIYCSSSPIDLYSSHCSATDNIPPEFITYPSDIIAYADVDDCATAVQWSPPLVTDNCSIDDLISTSNSGDIFPVGNTKVTYMVFDKAGNNAETSFNILVLDSISPLIIGLPNFISMDADLSTCGANVNWVEPTSTDNCSAILTSDFNSGDLFPIGITSVTYTAVDPSGNVAVTSFDIEVTIPHIPVFTNCPTDTIVYTKADNCEIPVIWEELEVVGCGITMSQSHQPGDLFAIGLHDIVYKATDISGNTVTCNFSIQVLDTFPPVFEFCPTEFEIVSVDTLNEESVISWQEPIARDFCSETMLISNYNPRDSFSFGITTIIYTATDGHGNESTCSFNVESGINNPPSIKSQYLSSKSGESINICLSAEDPDGDQVKIKTIRVNGAHATIEDVDSLALCFIYTSFENFGGIDTVLVEIIDDGLPNMSAFTEVVIEVEREQNIYPSSAITPNGDGCNDIWIIKNIDLYSDNSVSIYDRWGGLIYNEAGYNNLRNVWDGSNTNGAIVPTGTYFYVINFDNNENITGPIEVIR